MPIRPPHPGEDAFVWQEEVSSTFKTTPSRVTARTTTTNNTPTTLLTVPILDGAVTVASWTVMARQTAGSAGTVGDGLVHEGRCAANLIAGTATLIDAVAAVLNVQSAAWTGLGVAGSGNRLAFTVTGDTNLTIGWAIILEIRRMTG